VRWEEGRRSDNVVDARGRGLPIVGGGIGMAVLALVVYLMGGDPTVVLNGGGQGQPVPREAGAPANAGGPGAPAQDQMSQFVSVVLADTEDTWSAIFKQKFGRDYEDPKLVLFTGAFQSACGLAQSAMGPFYCPNDQTVYIDLAFYRELKDRFGAPGDFAQAYVIAHEVGHHVQNLLGISDKVRAAQERSDKAGANALSVDLELQADCYAGVWGNHAQRARNILEPGDVDEALNAASAIGDDKIQKATRGYVVPESFTHGSSAQRQQWFRTGFESGNLDACDTFSRANTRAAY
jgi:predicted metalloprotease